MFDMVFLLKPERGRAQHSKNDLRSEKVMLVFGDFFEIVQKKREDFLHRKSLRKSWFFLEKSKIS